MDNLYFSIGLSNLVLHCNGQQAIILTNDNSGF